LGWTDAILAFRVFTGRTWRCDVRHVCIAVVATIGLLFSTGQVAAQYGPEAEGAEPSPIVDPDTETDDSSAELEKLEAMDGKDEKTQTEVPESDRKERGCAIDPSSSTPSRAPIATLLFAAGLVGFRRLWIAR
jgi:hypothetical protein